MRINTFNFDIYTHILYIRIYPTPTNIYHTLWNPHARETLGIKFNKVHLIDMII